MIRGIPLIGTTLATVGALLAGTALADMTRGTIAAVDSAKDMIRLEDGRWFELGTGLQSDKLSAGDRVRIDHDFYQKGYPVARQIAILSDGKQAMTGKARAGGRAEMAAAERMLSPNAVKGVVTSIDRIQQHITLSTGDIFKLGTAPSTEELNTGDLVVVEWWTRNNAGYKVAGRVHTVREASADGSTAGMDGVPYSKHTVQGTVASVDRAENMVRLENGTILKLGTGLHSSRLDPGDEIRARWSTWAQGFRRADELEVLSRVDTEAYDTKFVRAEVTDVDRDARTISLAGQGRFQLAKGATLFGLEPGKPAEVWYQNVDGEKIAVQAKTVSQVERDRREE